MVFLRTNEDGNVTLHPKSVNTVQPEEFESCFLMYHEKLRSSCIFIYDTTMVPTLPLLFFCDNFFLTSSGGYVIIELNNALRFSCDKTTANLIVVSRYFFWKVLTLDRCGAQPLSPQPTEAPLCPLICTSECRWLVSVP